MGALENIMTQDEFRELTLSELHAGVVEVTFTKVDGTLRVMNCTLSQDIVPATETASTKTKAKNLEAQVVYDTDAKAWRSFRWRSVTKLCLSRYNNVREFTSEDWI
jgi:hypothetical protein